MKLSPKSVRNTKDVKALKETPRGYKKMSMPAPLRGTVCAKVSPKKKGY